MSENLMATKADLKEMYDRMLPYLGGSADAGFTPIGTIIPMIAETAPANYLICDGATYNKSDYPELAAHLLSMTNHSMYEVSGDSTKFKVPDLRGEFLRGTGTNSHANQGSGAAVGIHQNATELPKYTINQTSLTENNLYLGGDTSTGSGVASNRIINGDSNINSSTYADVSMKKDGLINRTGENALRITTRPTNTSVLFCIATKNIYLNPSLDYSTDEKVVGTWIDGKPIYQRTIQGNIVVINDGEIKDNPIDISSSNVETLIKREGVFYSSDGIYQTGIPYTVKSTNTVYSVDAYVNTNTQQLVIQSNRLSYNNRVCLVTIQYTKTTS